MAESDPDSNSLRQDQPECPEHNARGVLGGNTRVCSPIGFAFCDTADRTGCHRTTRATIRFRLDGGPQGRNPHLLRTSSYTVRGHKPFEAAFGCGRTVSPTKSGGDRLERPPVSLAFSAFHPNALYHLRALDWCSIGRFQPTFAFNTTRVGCINPSDYRRCAARSPASRVSLSWAII